MARMLQHEVDHLDGILLLERLDPRQRKEAMRALRQRALGLDGGDDRAPVGRPRCASPSSGTPEVAVGPLRALVDAGHDVALVVSRPDRRRGRGGALVPSPVKAAALELGLPVTDRVDDVHRRRAPSWAWWWPTAG